MEIVSNMIAYKLEKGFLAFAKAKTRALMEAIVTERLSHARKVLSVLKKTLGPYFAASNFKGILNFFRIA